MTREFDSCDAAKSVLGASGDPVGTIESVEGGQATVRTHANLGEKTDECLGWNLEDETGALDVEQGDFVDTDGVRLREL